MEKGFWLTFIASVELWLADEGRTVDLIAAEEDVGGVGVAAPDIARDILPTAPVVALMLLTAASEKAIPLYIP